MLQVVQAEWLRTEGMQLPIGYTHNNTRAASSNVIQNVTGLISDQPVRELAAGLENDPDRMFEYVQKQIEFDPYWGSMKGPLRTLLDDRGNDADQSRLLAALWETIGHEYRFVRGTIQLDLTNAKKWFGCQTTSGLETLLNMACIPWTNNTQYEMDHVWLQDKDAGGLWRDRDPALVPKQVYPVIDIATLSSYSSSALNAVSTFSTNAHGGLLNMDKAGIYAYMDQCTSNLVDALTNRLDQYAYEVFGGIRQDNTQPPISCSYTLSTTTNLFPTALEHHVTFSFGETSLVYTIASISAEKLALSFDEQDVDSLETNIQAILQAPSIADVSPSVIDNSTTEALQEEPRNTRNEILIEEPPPHLTTSTEEIVPTNTVRASDSWGTKNAAMVAIINLLLFAPKPEDPPPLEPLQVEAEDFGYMMWEEPYNHYVKLSNIKDSQILITNISITGIDASAFVCDQALPAALSGDQTGYLLVTITPPEQSRYLTADMKIDYLWDGVAYSVTVPLRASGGPSAPFINLWINDTMVASTQASTNGNSLTISIAHPYPDCDQTVEYSLAWYNTYAYTIMCGFGANQDGGFMKYRQAKLDQLLADGKTFSDFQTKTESLNVMGHTWLTETAQANVLQNNLFGVRTITHHRFGVMAQEEGYYVDVKAQLVGTISDSLYYSNAKYAAFAMGGLVPSAMEHGMIEQLQGTNKQAISTIRILELANRTGEPVYLINSNNVTSMLPLLTNYTTNVLSGFTNGVTYGYDYILPASGAIGIPGTKWEGHGYISYHPLAMMMIISGDYSDSGIGETQQEGGYAGNPDPVSLPDIQQNSSQNRVFETSVDIHTGADPVDMATGALLYEHADLVIGHGILPTGITLRRHYNSQLVNQQTPLGSGWNHSLNITANPYSDFNSMLGGRTAADAAIAALGLYVASFEWGPDIDEWMRSSLIVHWLMDRLTDNAVTIKTGEQSMSYTRLPNGTYLNPPKIVATLTQATNGCYRLTQPDGATTTFGVNNKVASLTDKNGNEATFTYNDNDTLNEVTDSYGRILEFDYRSTKMLTATYGEHVVNYDQKFGNLSRYSDPANNNSIYINETEGYTYNASHQLITITNALGQRTVQNYYSPLGCVTSQISATGNEWRFAISGPENIQLTPSGNRKTYYYDNQKRLLGIEQISGQRTYTTYDAQNRITQQTDLSGHTTHYQFNALHNPTNIINPLGHHTINTYDAAGNLLTTKNPLGQTTTIEYDAQHNPIHIINPMGDQTTIDYDTRGRPILTTRPNGLQTATTYDTHGNPATKTHTGDFGTHTNTSTWTPIGNLLSTKGPNGQTTTFTHDKGRRLITQTDPASHTTSNTYNLAGQLTAIRDKRGNTTQLQYDLANNPVATHYPDGTTTSNRYNADDQLITTINPRGTTNTFTYDAAGRIATILTPSGTTTNQLDPNGNLIVQKNPLGHTTTNQYDALNRLVATTDPLGHTISNTYNAIGLLVSQQDALGHTTTNRYNQLNQLISTTDPLGQTSTNAYDLAGNFVAHRSRRGQLTRYEYDQLNQPTVTIRPDGTRSTTTFDPAGNISVYTDPRGNAMHFAYDSMNRKTNRTDAAGHTTSWTYDPNGNPLTRREAGQTIVTRTYNSMNQLATAAWSNGQTATYQYDPSGNLIHMADWNGTTTFSHDPMNRPTHLSDSTSATLSNQYNALGQRTKLTHPTGTITYQHDTAGRITQLTDTQSGTYTFTYNANHQLITINYPNGTHASYSYNQNQQITNLTHSHNSIPFIHHRITFDPDGNPIQKEILAGPVPTMPSTLRIQKYAPNNQLTNAQHNPYNPFQWENQTITHDTAGRIIRIDSTNKTITLTRNSSGRITTLISNATPVATYQYNALGQRITRNGKHLLLDPTQEGDHPIGNATWGPGGLLAYQSTNGIRYCHSGEQGSIIALTDTNGTVTDTFAYLPYGQHQHQHDAGPGTTDIPYTWLGSHGVTREPNDLYYMNARYYHATMRRFMSTDPLGLIGGANLYLYGNSSPLRYIDPFGLCASGFDSSGNIQTADDGRFPSYMPGVQQEVYEHNTAVAAAREAAHPYWLDEVGCQSVSIFEDPITALAFGLTKMAIPRITVQPKDVAYRYVSEGEAAVSGQNGMVPNVTRAGDPKYVHYSGEKFGSASATENALQIGSKNPFGATASPTHRVMVNSAGADWITGGNVAGGTGTELITAKELSVIKISPLGR